MTDSATLLLHVEEGRPLPVQIHKESAVRSPHTGKDLQELHGWVVTSDAQLHQRLATILPGIADRPMSSEDETGEFGGKWCVSWNSYGEAAGVHTYTLILREAEDLSLRALQLDEIELHPYEYREEVIAGGLKVRGKLVGTEGDVLRLRRLAAERDSLDVIRLGIQDAPRRMRLNVEEWSQFEDRVKYRISLVDVGVEPVVVEEVGMDDADGGRAALAFYANFLERLAETLVRKEILSREELRVLREAARSEPGVTRHEIWRVADVDQA